MDENSNTLKDLLGEKELETYIITPYPFNVSILRNALDTKLKEDPSYEVWVPLYYYRFESFMRNKASAPFLQPAKVFISNKGGICRDRGDLGNFVYAHSVDEDGYYMTEVNIAKRREKFIIHRAMACVFIPLPKELGIVHPKELHVNHLDGIKQNIELDNLEWATPKQNYLHAMETGLISVTVGEEHHLTKPVKGVVKYGEYKGETFALTGTKEITALGFSPSRISECCNGKYDEYRGYSWSFASSEEIKDLPKGPSEGAVKSLCGINFKAKTKVLATNIETKEVMTLVGRKALEKAGFASKSVSMVVNQKLASHKGYTFERVPL